MTDEWREAILGHLWDQLKEQFYEGPLFSGVASSDKDPSSEREHVSRGQSLASGRGSVKQRPNHPNSAAQTGVLRHILLYLIFYFIFNF